MRAFAGRRFGYIRSRYAIPKYIRISALVDDEYLFSNALFMSLLCSRFSSGKSNRITGGPVLGGRSERTRFGGKSSGSYVFQTVGIRSSVGGF